MRVPTTRIIAHFIVVVLLLLMPIVDAPSPQPTALLMLENPFVEIDFVLHAACVGFGYLNYFVLIPGLFHQRRKVVYFIVVAGIFTALCFLPVILSSLPFIPFFEEQSALHIHTIVQVRHIFFLFMVIFLFSLNTWSEARRREAEREKSVAEMRFLKAQINPHFLFNTLNSIYAMLQVNPVEAGRSLIKMSNIMRHTLSASENTYEPLKATISDIDDFISLQKERFGATVELDYSAFIDRDDLKIAPLILIPFIENAFKYGIDPGCRSVIRIRIRNQNANLSFFIENTDFSKQQNMEQGAGIGMTNTQNRLDLIYPGKHTLHIGKGNGLFVVNLVLQLT